MFYVLPVENILGKLPVVPVGDTGTIPYSMWQHAEDFVDAAFDISRSHSVRQQLKVIQKPLCATTTKSKRFRFK